MRTGQPVISRPAWHDRNPIVIFRQYSVDAVTPHGDTERWSYTVPPGKKAFLEVFCIEIVRATAASTPGLVIVRIALWPSGGNLYRLVTVRLRKNAVGDDARVVGGQSLIMNAGDIISGFTVDPSTGGTVDYTVIVKITEFDA